MKSKRFIALFMSLVMVFSIMAASNVTATETEAQAAIGPNALDLKILDVMAEQKIAEMGVEFVRYMSEDIGVRVTGTPGEYLASVYVQEELESLGYETVLHHQARNSTVNQGTVTILNPELYHNKAQFGLDSGGTNKGFFTENHTNVWPTGAAGNGRLTAGSHGSATRAEMINSQPPVVGEVVFVGTGANDAAFANASGKIALLSTSANATIAARAVANGAIGLLGHSSGTGGRGGYAGVSSPTVNAGTPIPVLGLAHCQGEWLKGMVALNLETPVMVELRSVQYVNIGWFNVLAKKPAKNKTFDAQGRETTPILMIGGHIDTVNGAPGANDNAAGTGFMMAAAHAFAHLNTDNVELRFASWGAEESGLTGSTYYVNSGNATGANRLNAQERGRFIGYYNSDMPAAKNLETPARVDTVRIGSNAAQNALPTAANARLTSVVQSMLNTAVRLGYNKNTTSVDYRDNEFVNGLFASSDHVPFYNVSIPTMMSISMGHDMRVGNNDTTAPIAASNYYIERYYHTPQDTMVDNFCPDRFERITEVTLASMYGFCASDVPITIEAGRTAFLAGDEVKLTASFDTPVDTNVAILNYVFDTNSFGFKSFEAPAGAKVILAEPTEEGAVVTLMLVDGKNDWMNVKGLGTITLVAKEDSDTLAIMAMSAESGDSVNKVYLNVEFVVDKDNKVAKTGIGLYEFVVNSKTTFTIIDLSNIIDWFGVTSRDAAWREARFWDFGGDVGVIDILDIVFVAKKII